MTTVDLDPAQSAAEHAERERAVLMVDASIVEAVAHGVSAENLWKIVEDAIRRHYHESWAVEGRERSGGRFYEVRRRPEPPVQRPPVGGALQAMFDDCAALQSGGSY